MTIQERIGLDDLAGRYDRPRGWILRKLIGLFSGLEKAREAKTLSPPERDMLIVIRKGMNEPVRPGAESE